MKIVYIVTEFSNPGGIGRVTVQKANYLISKGYDVTIITELQGDSPSFYSIDNRVRHIDIGIPLNTNKILKIFLRRKKLKTILEKIHPDIVVHTITYEPVKCSFKYKSILECHFNHDEPILHAKAFNSSLFFARMRVKYFEYIASKFDTLVVLTQQDKKLWQEAGLCNVVTIPNMLSFECDEVPNLTAKRAIAVGRLDAQKSFDKLIKIWAKVNERINDWKLDIYGTGSDKNEYNKLITKLNLTKNVHIFPPVKNIKEKYLNSSFLCLTSTYEGFGLVLSEAMACGLPVISYDTLCGPCDLIEDSVNGFLVPYDDESKYVELILKLIEDYDLRVNMGKKAKSGIAKLSVDNVMRTWESLFQKLLN